MKAKFAIQLEVAWSLCQMKFTIYKNKISVSTVIFIKYTLKENIKKDYTNPV